MTNLKELRELTGANVSDCVRALNETNGDLQRAITIVKERGQEPTKTPESKLGAIGTYQHSNNQIAAMVFLSCKTKTTSSLQQFITLANALALHIALMNPSSIDDLLTQSYIIYPDNTINKLLSDFSENYKEEVSIQKFSRYEI